LSLRVKWAVNVIADLSTEALAENEEAMAEMSKVYDGAERELYMGVGDREHD
jgi:hypothetical protein